MITTETTILSVPRPSMKIEFLGGTETSTLTIKEIDDDLWTIQFDDVVITGPRGLVAQVHSTLGFLLRETAPPGQHHFTTHK